MPGSLQVQRTQLRALLLLLALLPLLPSGVMIRFMFESVLQEREILRAELESLTLQQSNRLAEQFQQRYPSPTVTDAPEIAQWLQIMLGPDALVRVTQDATGRQLAFAGDPEIRERAAWYELQIAPPGWTLEWARPLPGFFSAEFRRQTWQMILVAGGTLMLTSSIALIAGREMTRRMELTELRSDRLSQIAHELRTPVASLRALTETLQDTAITGQQQTRQEYYGMLERETRRLWLVSEMFLWHSRLERHGALRLQSEPLILNILLREVTGEFQLVIDEARGRLKLDLPDEPVRIVTDPEALKTIFRNLVDNAVKYCGETPPDISVTLQPPQPNAQPSAKVQVIDQGIGISREHQTAIFQSFTQLDDHLHQNRGGCGLGLSIVKGLVQAHKGAVTVESRPVQGSCFTVLLPTTIPDQAFRP